MDLIPLSDGQYVQWDPTTALVCSCCQATIDVAGAPQRSLLTTNFMFDLREPKETSLVLGKYWYFHKQCSHMGDVLAKQGAKIAWGWYDMRFVLGQSNAHWKSVIGDIQAFLQQRLPPGCYDQLYHQWLPAIPKPQRLPRHAPSMTPRNPPRPGLLPSRPPRSGYVYLIEALGLGLIKIGHGRNAAARLRQLSTGTPVPLRVLHTIATSNSYALEQILHARYARYKQHNEWFALPSELLAALLTEKFA